MTVRQAGTKLTICRETQLLCKYKFDVSQLAASRVIRCQMIIPINWRHFWVQMGQSWGEVGIRFSIQSFPWNYLNLSLFFLETNIKLAEFLSSYLNKMSISINLSISGLLCFKYLMRCRYMYTNRNSLVLQISDMSNV